MQEENIWYVVYTRPRWEKKISATLSAKGIENYCPLNKVLRQWSDRQKVVMEPLFKGYLFVKVPERNKWDIKSIDGILNYVYWLGKPARVKEEEIITIRKFLDEFNDVEVLKIDPKVNGRVSIKHGVLMNYKGVVMEVHGNRAKVRITGMQVELTAFFDTKNLNLLES